MIITPYVMNKHLLSEKNPPSVHVYMWMCSTEVQTVLVTLKLQMLTKCFLFYLHLFFLSFLFLNFLFFYYIFFIFPFIYFSFHLLSLFLIEEKISIFM